MDCFASLAMTMSQELVRQKNPTGKSPKVCPAQRKEIFRLRRRANQRYYFARLTRQEGRLAIVTKRAVGCGGRGCADDERHVRRTAKSCGPDTPTLVSSF